MISILICLYSCNWLLSTGEKQKGGGGAYIPDRILGAVGIEILAVLVRHVIVGEAHPICAHAVGQRCFGRQGYLYEHKPQPPSKTVSHICMYVYIYTLVLG